ncbi:MULTISPECIES: methyl-accepting chemotaxis protein [Pelosinus]|uniref:Chemotaxis sensory transducer n=1 Tax=Pelosinus fermentans B4 TaxID=1149862 RepID=I8RFA8_9FIRM|nr:MULTISPECIES: methyl-accepting chemotaxis protein [Pelosinus]EIW16305.1 chemotaxis sensory transducer [Pelosinus fermentans B4]EIW22714.1 methyl-accepting chemotaxis sensory transducer [Pelosinus fermentans A11]OAM95612.1 methyl-accepting chemotaxis sensory transducer [Pelosinus fermentans DSM 17108]SDR30543.1 methyl-accepting chemotaxis protein [Pelosinus fermentans]
MTIRIKILSGFMVVIALVFIMSAFTYFQVGELNSTSKEIMRDSLYQLELVEELAIDVSNEAVAMRRFNFTGDLADVATFDNYRKYGDDKINKLQAALSFQNSQAVLETLKKEKLAFDTIAAKSIEAKRANNIEQVGIYMQQAGKPSENSIAATKELILLVKGYVREQEEHSTQKASEVQLLLVLVSLFVAAIAIGISIYISRGISIPAKLVAQAASEITLGNLAVDDIKTRSSDELGQLAASFNQMKSNLRLVIEKVAHAADQVMTSSQQLTASASHSTQAAGQIAASISDMAQGAEMQLTTFTETTVAVQQMSVGIQQIANNATIVAGKSSQASETAIKGGESIEKAINQMAQIEKTVNTSAQVITKLGEQSKEIGQIVSTISGIAGQTNLLALNAAIEAARAGEQGRGFAVVAEEVRKLAEQSQEAAKKIAQLIGEIQGDTTEAVIAMTKGTTEVKIGAEVVDVAGKSFQEIAQLILEVSTQIKDISSAIQQIADGSQVIVLSVKEIDALSKKTSEETQTVSAATQEQSASMEEIASSSQILGEMAQNLQEVVNKFRF